METLEIKYIKLSVDVIDDHFYVNFSSISKTCFLPDNVKFTNNLSEKKINFENYYYTINKSLMECYIKIEKYPKFLMTIITFSDKKEKINFLMSDVGMHDFDLNKLNHEIKDKIIEIKSLNLETLNVETIMFEDDIFF